ncbi:IclR family transcriptional regulator [Natronorubrum bangense]|uniref:ArcR family transcription regulator n=2 Tax=Natronorubrum bangense TaxID=61858 RepID=L9WSL1_9EURY|nr:IclR family transcriptional regulator [Natronorubrum bangense]ELY51308.1 ArcR family transcription regulator [Natronorubrum bangense JCM 10635]QCC54709.1 IclR family transcriptional regulator [Natronorubrum bangense]
MRETNDEGPRQLETVARACDVIDALEELDGAGVTELADSLDISKSSAYSYLSTLRTKRLVVKDDDDTYRLSLEFLYLGKTIRHRHVLFEHGKQQIDRLAEETGEYVHLMCEQHGLERNIYKVAGENAVGDAYHTTKERKADFLHFTSTGKAVLAYLPDARVEAIIDEYGLVRKTENTITDRDALFKEIQTIRERGYAVNDEEEVAGIRAVGAPIRDTNGAILGAISVSGPTSRLNDDRYHETLPKKVMESANVTEASINMSNASQSL